MGLSLTCVISRRRCSPFGLSCSVRLLRTIPFLVLGEVCDFKKRWLR